MRDYWNDPPDDPPEYDQIAYREVKKTRKPWKCSHCGKQHEAGGPCRLLVGKLDDKFFSDRTCLFCPMTMEEL